MEVVNESIYDHPKFYDLVFGTDCAAELRFISAVNDRFLKGRGKQLFEPACGTGRLLAGLAKRGFAVEGIDLNEKAVAYSNARSRRHGSDETAWVADMADFRPRKKFDLAFNTINSFRHLLSPQQPLDHLQCMADGAKKNAIYLIGIHLVPTDVAAMEEESWAARRGHLSVLTHMWTVERNPQKRFERFGIKFDIYTPTQQFRIEDELQMRSYNRRQFDALIARSGCWDIEATYDFTYDIDQPITLDGTSEDVVFVLRKR